MSERPDRERLHPFPWRGEGPWDGVEASPYEGEVGVVGSSYEGEVGVVGTSKLITHTLFHAHL